MPYRRRPVFPQQRRANLQPVPVNPSIGAPVARAVVPTVIIPTVVPSRHPTNGLNSHPAGTILTRHTVAYQQTQLGTIVPTIVATPVPTVMVPPTVVLRRPVIAAPPIVARRPAIRVPLRR